jgi:fibronectin type 3 domain-containing protein
MVTLAYTGYNFTQKLLNQFNEQNTFFVQLNEMNKRFSLLSQIATKVERESESKFLFRSDSIDYTLELTPKNVLITQSGNTDTFNLETNSLKCDFEDMSNPILQGKLINSFSFDVLYQKETFQITFTKQYDAYLKLMLETQK